MTVFKITSARALLAPILGVMLISLSGCGDEEVATEPVAPVVVSPDASDEKPMQTEIATLEIRDGDFSNDKLILLQQVPTTLRIVNHDDTAYRIEIEGLVSIQPVPASDTTEISFTTPSPDTYTGQLLGESEDTVLAEISVIVHSPGGVEG